MLRVEQLTLELIGAGEVRHVTLVVAVVTGAGQQHAADEGLRLAGGLVHRFHRPATRSTIPVGRTGLQPVVDVIIHPIFLRSLTDVLANGRAIGQHLERMPRAELVPEAKHVGIRTDARVPEQVPGATQALAPLDQCIAQPGTLPGDMAGHANTGQTGADDEHINVGGTHAVSCLHPCECMRLLLILNETYMI